MQFLRRRGSRPIGKRYVRAPLEKCRSLDEFLDRHAPRPEELRGAQEILIGDPFADARGR